MKIAALVGSLRKNSYNKQVAVTMQQRYKDKLQIEIVDIGTLPYYNQDEEMNPPDVVREFKEALKNADGVVIVTPEFNWSVPGVLKNALDWASWIDKVFAGKPVMTLGASPGMLGTVRAQLHLREILSSPGMQARVLPPGGNEVLISVAHEKFDPETGELTDEATLAFLDEVVDKFIAFVRETTATGTTV